jgi:hypothetical protein
MKKMTPEQRQKQLNRLAELPDSDIDTSDIPELTVEQLRQAVRGKKYEKTSRQTPLPKKAAG